jgi:hypothetical protein
MKGYQVAEFCSARSQMIRPPQWPSIAPPITDVQLGSQAINLACQSIVFRGRSGHNVRSRIVRS